MKSFSGAGGDLELFYHVRAVIEAFFLEASHQKIKCLLSVLLVLDSDSLLPCCYPVYPLLLVP